MKNPMAQITDPDPVPVTRENDGWCADDLVIGDIVIVAKNPLWQKMNFPLYIIIDIANTEEKISQFKKEWREMFSHQSSQFQFLRQRRMNDFFQDTVAKILNNNGTIGFIPIKHLWPIISKNIDDKFLEPYQKLIEKHDGFVL